MRATSDWISTNERLPDKEGKYLTITNGFIEIRVFHFNDAWQHSMPHWWAEIYLP